MWWNINTLNVSTNWKNNGKTSSRKYLLNLIDIKIDRSHNMLDIDQQHKKQLNHATLSQRTKLTLSALLFYLSIDTVSTMFVWSLLLYYIFYLIFLLWSRQELYIEGVWQIQPLNGSCGAVPMLTLAVIVYYLLQANICVLPRWYRNIDIQHNTGCLI